MKSKGVFRVVSLTRLNHDAHEILEGREEETLFQFVFFVTFVIFVVAFYILKTPNLGGRIGALNAAESASASTVRVCAGSRMPSSHSRAVE